LGKKVTAGWQVLNVTSIMTGPPFTVYSGIQQTGAGAGGTDRPNLVSTPDLSTSRTVREDYFGRGANNSSFFSFPINLPGVPDLIKATSPSTQESRDIDATKAVCASLLNICGG
jgi:hypothetical protein